MYLTLSVLFKKVNIIMDEKVFSYHNEDPAYHLDPAGTWGRELPAPYVLPRGEVRSLFQQSLKYQYERAARALDSVSEYDNKKKKESLRNYLTNAVFARHEVKAKALAERAKDSPDEINEAAGALKRSIPNDVSVVFKEEAKKYNSRSFYKKYNELFQAPITGGGTMAVDRIYLDITNESLSPIQQEIETYLTNEGYKITNYRDGLAEKIEEEGGNVYKMGKLLKSNPKLSDNFVDDPCRSCKGRLLAVLSRHPHDILAMSTGRRWEACTTYGKEGFDKYAKADLAGGSIAAYLIHAGDPGIRDPLARILIKSYENQETGEEALIPNITYGREFEPFSDTVMGFLESTYNKDKMGYFCLPSGIFRDEGPDVALRAPVDCNAEEFLDLLGADYEKDGDEIIVSGDLDMSNLGIHYLPNLSKVKVMGDWNIEKNPLSSFDGAPNYVGGVINAKRVPLISVYGVPNNFKSLVTDNKEYGNISELPDDHFERYFLPIGRNEAMNRCYEREEDHPESVEYRQENSAYRDNVL